VRHRSYQAAIGVDVDGLLYVRHAGADAQIDDVEENTETSQDDQYDADSRRLSVVEWFRRRCVVVWLACL